MRKSARFLILNMLKQFKLHNLGSSLAIGIEGNEKEHEEWYNFFFNWNITSGKLLETDDDCLKYIITSERRLLKGLANVIQNRLNIKTGLEKLALQELKARFIPESFLKEIKIEVPQTFKLTLTENKDTI